MNRDAIIATIIGFGIGLGITGIFLFGPKLIKYLHNMPTISFPKKAPLPTPTPPNLSLTIDAPIAESIEASNSVLVSGSAPKDSLLILEGPLEEIVLKPNGDGKYAGKVTILEGKNELFVTSYVGGTPSSQSVVVYYTPEKF